MVSVSPAAPTRVEDSARRRARLGGVLLGLGIGGFFDGIVLHQLLQWHHMLSSVYPPDTLHNMDLNARADGFFHLGTYLFTLAGLCWLWSGVRGTHRPWSTAAFVGTLLLGFGLFNVVEGLIDHQILGVHHVRPGPHQLAYDLGFLLWGAVMIVLGLALMRRRASREV